MCHFILKKLAEEFKKQITCLSTEKKITFTAPIEKEVRELTKIEKKLQKIYLTKNLLIAQDLLEAH